MSTTATHPDVDEQLFLSADGSVFMAQGLASALPLYRLTQLQYDVWNTLIGELKDGGYVYLTLEEIGEILATGKNNISPAINRLGELGLIWREANGIYRFNPRVVFKGTREEWIRALDDIPEELPEIVLPKYRRRPPRGHHASRLKVVS